MREYADQRMIDILGKPLSYHRGATVWNTEMESSYVHSYNNSPISSMFCKRLKEAEKVGQEKYLPSHKRETATRECLREIEDRIIQTLKDNGFRIVSSKEIAELISEEIREAYLTPGYKEKVQEAKERAEVVIKEWEELVARLETLHTNCIRGLEENPPAAFRNIEREYKVSLERPVVPWDSEEESYFTEESEQ